MSSVQTTPPELPPRADSESRVATLARDTLSEMSVSWLAIQQLWASRSTAIKATEIHAVSVRTATQASGMRIAATSMSDTCPGRAAPPRLTSQSERNPPPGPPMSDAKKGNPAHQADHHERKPSRMGKVVGQPKCVENR